MVPTDSAPDGNPQPTYDNTDIREFAKIFTGLAYAGSADRGAPDLVAIERCSMRR